MSRPVAELIEMALIFAVQDRESYADAWGRASPEAQEAMGLVAEFRAYHKRRFGRAHLTPLEETFSRATVVTLSELKSRLDKGGQGQ